MSKTGTDSSVSGERGDTANAAATAFASACAVASAAEPSSRAPDAGGAAVVALVSTGGSRRTSVMPKTSAAPHAATSARDGTTIRPIDVPVKIRDPWPDRWLVSTPGVDPALICSGHQVRLTGIPSVSHAAQCTSRCKVDTLDRKRRRRKSVRPPDSCHGNAYGALVAWVALLIIVNVSGFDFRQAQPSDFRLPEAGAILPTFA